MAKSSIITDAKDTMVEAAKSSAEGVKTVAGEALGAAAVAAAGVVLDRVSAALSQGAQQVETSRPAAEQSVSNAAVSFVGGTPARKRAKKKSAKKSAKKQSAAAPAKKAAKKTSKKKSAKKAAGRTAKKSAAKKKTAGRKSAVKKSAVTKKSAKKSVKKAGKRKAKK